MMYEQYKDNRVYGSQAKINFPRRDPETDRIGEGNMLFLLSPTREDSLEFICDETIALNSNYFKRLITDALFKERVGSKRVIQLERSKTDRFYMNQQKELPIRYVPYASRHTYIEKKKNLVNDLSRWMEITFSRLDYLPVKRKCAEFIRILSERLNDSAFQGYNKILVIDINAWVQSVKSCVIMNKKLLNNPLSILFYAAYYYPKLLENFPECRIMIVNRAAKQVYFCQSSFITKKNYPKIKAKLNMFKNVIFSVEDESGEASEEHVDEEVTSEIINSFKDDVKEQLRHNLLGPSVEDPFNQDAEDITGEVAEPFDDGHEYTEDELEDDDKIGDINITDEIASTVNKAFDEIDDLDDMDRVDTDQMIKRLTRDIEKRKYRTAFLPQRSTKEEARIERLTEGQSKVLDLPTAEDVKRKSLTPHTVGGYIKTTNPTIVDSKFANFDKEYVEKNLNKNIDSAVAGLSNGSSKIFVTGKEVTDSSDPMNLKELYTYHLQDERGNKFTVSFDVPKIIDGSYVYLNGSRKVIKHQLILKPIVKTSSDIVQIVTAYNKVFIYRKGVENQNANRIRTYLKKNEQRFKVRSGNCSMLNGDYEVPLDFSIISRYYSEFTIGDITFFMSLNRAEEEYKKMAHKSAHYDESHEIPIGINRKTKELVTMRLDESYIEKILSFFPAEDQKKISAIHRKPRYIAAQAKIMGSFLPLILFMLYCEGFASVMKKANIQYEFISKDQRRKYDPMKWDSIELADGIIMWQKIPFRNELLMNGLKKCDMSQFTYDELESKDTYISLIIPFYARPGIDVALDNFRDFLLDEKSKEILTDLGYPTDLVSLLVVAAGMLTDTKYMIENNLNNMRVRSAEVIPDLIYSELTSAYTQYRQSIYIGKEFESKRKPTPIRVPRNAIIKKFLSADVRMVEEASILNPIREVEKQRTISFKGFRGIQLDRAMTLPRRAYDKSMVGTLAIATPSKLLALDGTIVI